MIGVKSLAVIALAGGMLALAIASGALELEQLAHRSAGSAFAIGLFAALSAALVGWSARPGVESRAALRVVPGRPALVLAPAAGSVRELPPFVQRGLFVVAFACIALATFTNEATARIAAVPSDLAKPSRAEYCQDDEPSPTPSAPVPVDEPPPIDQAGCALVKRAFELGYTKSLGNCAPTAAKPSAIAAPVKQQAREVCTRRQHDEPFTHYAWRRVVETGSDISPIESSSGRVDTFRTRFDYAGDLLADIKHSITGTPHASHHIWVTLPDPHPKSWTDRFTGHEPCTELFAHLPLWPRWTESSSASDVFEHVLGQLLFATRFGTPASCSDYVIHWDAPDDACTKLAADPESFLAEQDALESIRAVLDRRKRQVALRALADELGDAQTLPVPPDARVVASTACFAIGTTSGAVRSADIVIDGEAIAMRELRATPIRATGRGPIDVYVQLALLLGGKPYTGPATATADRALAEPIGALDDREYPFLRLEPLVHADPFVASNGTPIDPLANAELVDVYPFEAHLFAFVDAFRRVYLPQRRRL